MMQKYRLHDITAIALLVVGIVLLPAPAMAVSSNIVSETKAKTELTVSQIKDLAVIYNPTNKTYALNQKELDLSQTTTANDLHSAQNALNSGYDIDTSTVTALQQQIRAQEAAGADEATLEALREQLRQAEAAVDSAYANNASSFDSAISNIEQLNNTLDRYEDDQDDLDKTLSDWETQVRMIAEVLCMQATQYEKNITLLKDQISLAEKALQLAKIQQSLGMTLTTEVQANQTSLEEIQQSLETAQESLKDIKRQINVLIGRAQDQPLEVISASVPVIGSVIPTYSQALVDEFIEVDYTRKTYTRAIANYKDDVDGETDSDVLEAADNNIAAMKLNIEERERAIADDVKAQLDKMAADKASYETSQTKVLTEKKNWEVAQQKYDLGLLTESQQLQYKINYENALLTHWKNSYNYYLDWQEYKAMKAGVNLSTYLNYRR